MRGWCRRRSKSRYRYDDVRAVPGIKKEKVRRLLETRERAPACVCPTCDLNDLLSPVIIVFAIGVLLLLVVTVVYWRWSGFIPWRSRWSLFTYMIGALVAAVSIVAIVLGILLTRDVETIVVEQSTFTNVRLTLLDNRPYSNRILAAYEGTLPLCNQRPSSSSSSSSSLSSSLIPVEKKTLEDEEEEQEEDVEIDVSEWEKEQDQTEEEEECDDKKQGETKKTKEKKKKGTQREEFLNKRAMFESVMFGIVFQTFEDGLGTAAVPTDAAVHFMTQLFRYALTRNAWRAKGRYQDTSTQVFVNGNFMPAGRNLHTHAVATRRITKGWYCGCLWLTGTCCYECTLNSWLHPAVVIAVLVFLVVVAGTFIYWVYLTDPETSRTDHWEVYFDALETFLSVPTLFLLVYAYVDATHQQDFTDTAGSESLELQLYTNYPHSVRAYRQLYPFDPFVQRIRDPSSSSSLSLGDSKTTTTIEFRTAQRVFEKVYADLLLHDMLNALRIETLPNTGRRTTWSSNFLAPFLVEHWYTFRNNWPFVIRDYIERWYLPHSSSSTSH